MREPSTSPDAARGRLRLPPAGRDVAARQPGRSEIRVGGRFAGLCYVPQTGVRRLVIMLHGAGGTAGAGLRLLLPHADERQLMLYAPQAAGVSWDLIRGGYGPDVRRIQAALDQLHGAPAQPPAIGGFSDGASYALSLGLINGDLFGAVLAFSPGFAAPTQQAGHPSFFVSHGRGDTVLPIDRCGRRVVRSLQAAGCPVHYHEFDGGHEVPPSVIDAALTWLAAVRADRAGRADR